MPLKRELLANRPRNGPEYGETYRPKFVAFYLDQARDCPSCHRGWQALASGESYAECERQLRLHPYALRYETKILPYGVSPNQGA